jgi:lysozyme family protein
MKENFDSALKHVLALEGGYTNDAHDPGGVTNLGIIKSEWERYVGHPVSDADMRALTPEKVTPLYKHKYWDAVKADDLPTGLDYLVFDFAVNAGVGQSSKTLQRCLGVVADGMIGPVTVDVVKRSDPHKLIEDFSQAKENFYRSLKTFPYFGRGWLNRVAQVKEIATKMA